MKIEFQYRTFLIIIEKETDPNSPSFGFSFWSALHFAEIVATSIEDSDFPEGFALNGDALQDAQKYIDMWHDKKDKSK